MKTEYLEYKIENIQMIFNYLTRCKEQGYERAYRIEIDGLEIVSSTTSLEHFNDFLFYSTDESITILFTIYHRHRVEFRYAFSMQSQQTEDEKEATICKLREESAAQLAQIKSLARTIDKLESKRIFEKPEDLKVIDAGEFVVVFFPKKMLEETLQSEVDNARGQLSLMEKAHRYYLRFIRTKT
jgi:hypothetical protein